jgi:hypothetical protein
MSRAGFTVPLSPDMSWNNSCEIEPSSWSVRAEEMLRPCVLGLVFLSEMKTMRRQAVK